MSTRHITSQRKLEINRYKNAISAGSSKAQGAGNKPVFKLITRAESQPLSAALHSPASPLPTLLIRDLLRGKKAALSDLQEC